MKSVRLFLIIAIPFLPIVTSATDQDQSGTEYAVQFLSSKKQLDPADKKFKGAKDIHEENIEDIYKYTTSTVKTLNDAVGEQAKMKEMGFKDAFVVRYKDGQRI